MSIKAQIEIKNQNAKIKMTNQNSKMSSAEDGFRNFYLLFLVFCFIFAGCQEKAKLPKSSKATKPLVGAKPAEQSETTLKRENEELKAENKQLKEQHETLMGIDKLARIEAISTVSSIELTNRCGIYEKANAVRRPQAEDSNDNTKKKTLVVYLKTIDDMGDVVKAPGAVKVELWNLNAKPAESLLTSWEIEPKELKKKWSGSLLTSYYKLQFDVNSILGKKEKELTLKVEFTDYLTGKILKAQRVIKQ
jgi:cell division protein FtsB